jgi:SAM-dependent methyltransferase
MTEAQNPFANTDGIDGVSARRAARAQWQTNPAGVVLAGAIKEGTPEFFAEMTRTRYEAQPWHPALLRGWAPRGTLLEIGCGAGTDHSILRETADRSIAIDLALRGASLTDTRIGLEGGRGTAIVADGEHLPLANASVDAVYSFGVIHHTDHPERVVAEMARTMRPGGSFLVAVYHRYSIFALQKVIYYVLSGRWGHGTWRRYLAGLEFGGDEQEEPPVIKLYSRRSIRQLFANAGLGELSTTTIHPSGFGRAVWPEPFERFGWYVVVRGRKPV